MPGTQKTDYQPLDLEVIGFPVDLDGREIGIFGNQFNGLPDLFETLDGHIVAQTCHDNLAIPRFFRFLFLFSANLIFLECVYTRLSTQDIRTTF